MPDPFMLEKIRSGEDQPYEVITANDQAVTVTNFDEGTVAVIDADGTVTGGSIDGTLRTESELLNRVRGALDAGN